MMKINLTLIKPTWLQAAQVKQARWKTASRALMTSSFDPSGRQQRLQRLTPNNLFSKHNEEGEKKQELQSMNRLNG